MLPPDALTGAANFSARDWLLLTTLAAGQILISADFSLASLAMPAIAGAFHISPSLAQWVIAAMMLGFAGFLLVGGRLSDLFGQKTCLMIGLALYSLGAFGSCLAGGIAPLIATRAVQGVGAALTWPAILSLIFLSFEAGPRRFLALTVSTALQFLAGPLSVIVAGVLFATLGWRGAFILTLPISLFGLCLVPMMVPATPGRAGGRSIDFPGAILATAGAALLVWTVPALAIQHAAASGLILAGFAAGLGLLGIFVLQQRRAAAPLVPAAVLRTKNLVTGVLVIAIITVSVAGLVNIALISLQQGLHFSPLQSGLAILPYGLISVAISFFAPRLTPILFRRPQISLVIALLSIAACYLLVSLAPHAPVAFFYLLAALIIAPIGGNLGFNLAMSETLQAVPSEFHGVASGLVYTGMQMGIAIGVALMIAAIDPARLGAASLAAFAGSYRTGAVICVAGVLLSLMMKDPQASGRFSEEKLRKRLL